MHFIIVSDNLGDVPPGVVLVVQRLQVVAWGRQLVSPQARQPTTLLCPGIVGSRTLKQSGLDHLFINWSRNF